MATNPAEPEKMTLDRSDGSATIDLYRAALGPLRADYYLKAFTRFDAAGHSGPGWNWAAALLSLNWMLFRKLWTVALSYVGAVVAATLLLFGIGRLVFQLSEPSQWALLLAAGLLAIAVPGAYGNAWLYAACNRKMERALKASATMEEACALLARQTGGMQRLLSLAGLNLGLCLVVAAVSLSWPTSGALPLHTGPVAQTQAMGQVTGQVKSGLVQSVVGTQTLSQPVTASPIATQTVTAPVAVASAPQPAASVAQPAAPSAASSAPAKDPRSQQGLVQEEVAVKQPPEKEAATAAPRHIEEKAGIAAPIAKAAKPTKAEKRAKAKAVKLAAQAAAKQAAKEAAIGTAKSKAAKATAAAATATAAKAASSAPESATYLINVGLFADPNNARNAFTKLQDAGVPALSQEVNSSKGTRTRVRVGPFETQAEADRVAERIRALPLDAVVIKQ